MLRPARIRPIPGGRPPSVAYMTTHRACWERGLRADVGQDRDRQARRTARPRGDGEGGPVQKMVAGVLGLAVAGLIVYLGRHPGGPDPVYQYRGAQQVAYYRVSQVGAVERHLGYRVVEPTRTVWSATALRLSQLVVTDFNGHKAIDYVFGDLHAQWVMVMETSDALTPYHYDPSAKAVFFASHGRGISVTTNLATGTLNEIVNGLGAPAHQPPAQV